MTTGTIIAVLVALGVVTTVVGLYNIHHVTCKSPWYSRAAAVLVTIFGLLTIWLTAASNTPVIRDPHLSVVQYSEKSLTLELSFENVRSCKLDMARVVLVDDKNLVKISETNGYLSLEGINRNTGFITVLHPTDIRAEYAYLEMRYSCPFGFYLVTEFPKVKLPMPTAIGVF